MSKPGVILFHTTSSAFRAEKVLHAAGLEFKLVPVPRSVSSDCGVAGRFDWAIRDDVVAALEAASVEVAAVLPLDRDKW